MEEAQKLEQLEPLMTIDELAAFLNVPKSWIYGQTRVAKRTGFPVTKVGKYCRFDRHRVMEWLRKPND
jgi:excisionase family DNA binding protein